MGKTNTKCAGIDVSKRTLSVAVHEGARFEVSNDAPGYRQIVERLKASRVRRVGLEASGNYEAGAVHFLRRKGFEVLVLDPGQVHGFRRFKNKRAKTDPIDAVLIAAVTAASETVKAAPDARLVPFCEHLTLIEQMAEDVARLKTRRERFQAKAHLCWLNAEIKRLTGLREQQIAKLVAALRAHKDLAERYDLLLSVPTIGVLLAVSLVVRMPELGLINRAEAAALAGVAPYNDGSGNYDGPRHIQGGRHRVRRILFLAAFSGSQRWNPILVRLYQRLIAAGKPHKVAVTACARKLLEIANAILARGTPWQDAIA